jgi:filamentous hemagglutinin
MVDVAGIASLLGGGAPGRPYKKPTAEEAPGASLPVPKEVERFGPVVSNRDVKIIWRKGIEDQGKPLEDYLEKEDPELVRLKPKATTFDFFKPISGEAISTKALSTLSVSYVKKPESIYKEIKGYVDEVLDYEPVKLSDLDPAMIESKSVYVAVPEWMSPTQSQHLVRGIIYGKDNGVSVVILRVGE